MKVRLHSYSNYTTLDLHLSQLYPEDYILLGCRVIHFRGKFEGLNRALEGPQEGLNKAITTENFPVMSCASYCFMQMTGKEANDLILGVTQQMSEEVGPAILQDHIQGEAVIRFLRKPVFIFYINR